MDDQDFELDHVEAADEAPETPAELNAKQKLRAFEDETFGPDAVRISGHVERGYGSRFKAMTPEQIQRHAALEHLVEAEHKLGEASAALATAQATHDAAAAKVEALSPAAAEEPTDAEHAE